MATMIQIIYYFLFW